MTAAARALPVPEPAAGTVPAVKQGRRIGRGNRTVVIGRPLVAFKYATTDDGEYLLVPVGVVRLVRKVNHETDN